LSFDKTFAASRVGICAMRSAEVVKVFLLFGNAIATSLNEKRRDNNEKIKNILKNEGKRERKTN